MQAIKKALLRFFDIFTRRHVLLATIEGHKRESDRRFKDMSERLSRFESDLYRMTRQLDVTCEFYERRIDNIHQNMCRVLEAESVRDEE